MTRYVIHECDNCRALNASLSARVARLGTQDILRRSHFLGGRYENLYVTPEALPGIDTILDTARQAASDRARVSVGFNFGPAGPAA